MSRISIIIPNRNYAKFLSGLQVTDYEKSPCGFSYRTDLLSFLYFLNYLLICCFESIRVKSYTFPLFGNADKTKYPVIIAILPIVKRVKDFLFLINKSTCKRGMMTVFTKIFSLLITAVIFFVYKNARAAGCSSLHDGKYGTYSCPKGHYFPETKPGGCTICPGPGTTDEEYVYYIGYTSCQSCSVDMISKGECDYLGQLNTFGVDIWLSYRTTPEYNDVTNCFLPRGTGFSDVTGQGIYQGKPEVSGDSIIYLGGSCYYSL